MKKKKYQKEVEEILFKYAKLLNHHLSRLFIDFANEVYKLNEKYFDMKELKEEN